MLEVYTWRKKMVPCASSIPTVLTKVGNSLCIVLVCGLVLEKDLSAKVHSAICILDNRVGRLSDLPCTSTKFRMVVEDVLHVLTDGRHLALSWINIMYNILSRVITPYTFLDNNKWTFSDRTSRVKRHSLSMCPYSLDRFRCN